MVAFFRGLLVLIFFALIVVVGAIAFFADPDIPNDLLVAKYGAAPSQFADLPSGAHAHYRDQGQANGLPLVLLHGSNASLHTWEPWVALLGDQFRVISIDLPSHGLTGAVPGDDYSQEGMAKFVGAVMTKLGVERFAVAGNSMGGSVAAHFALMQPERLTHLILVGAGGMPSNTPRDPGIGFRLARIPVVQNVLLYLTPRYFFDEGLKKAFVDDVLVTPAMVDRYWELNRRAGNRAATLKRFQTPFDTYIQDNASKITTPTLILWGELDTFAPRDAGEAYAQAIKGSKFIVYKNIGHIVMEEVPEQSARAVREFLAPSAVAEVTPDASVTPP